MARCKNFKWSLSCNEDDKTFSTDHIKMALLMDLRDELQEINELLRPLRRLDCPHFLRIPKKLDRIGRNTEKKKPANKKP